MTLVELRKAALQEAGILAAGEAASASDDQLVSQKYDALYDMLLTLGLVAWAAADDIPEYAEIPITQMLAAAIAPAFGIEGQKLLDLRAAGSLGLNPPSLAERSLRQQLARHYVSHPAPSEYF